MSYPVRANLEILICQNVMPKSLRNRKPRIGPDRPERDLGRSSQLGGKPWNHRDQPFPVVCTCESNDVPCQAAGCFQWNIVAFCIERRRCGTVCEDAGDQVLFDAAILPML